MKLIVGLGNPEKKHQKTRHNLGFMALDEFAKKNLGPEVTWSLEDKFQAEVLKINPDLMLVKPQTYMNNSGLAVSALVHYFKIPLENIIIVHDDLDIPLGKLKVRTGGSAAGHHGVESIINSLGSDNFIRVRMGIGNLSSQSSERGGQAVNMEKFVLEPFLTGEGVHIKQMLKKSVKVIDLLLEKGLESAQNQYN